MSTKRKDREKQLLSDFKECLKQNVEELQKHGVATQYERYLKEPKTETLPRMLQIDVDEFYRGELVKEYQPQAGFSVKHRESSSIMKAIIHGFQAGFSAKHRSESSRKHINMEEIFHKEQPKDKINHATIIGPAGAGKSTVLTRFSRDATNGKIPQIQDEDDVVHFVNCREFDANDIIHVSDFLFRNMTHKPSDDAIKVGYKWMLKHPKNVTFIIDSLDTLPYELDNERKVISPDASAPPSTILYNIFTGKLLPGCKILSSSREHKIRKYKGDLRAHRIVSLAGLTPESIEKLVFGFLGEEEGKLVLEYIKNKCPGLWVLIETPILLVFTLIGFSGKAEKSNFPQSMSAVMINLLDNLIHSQHSVALGSLSDEDIIDIISKLKKLSFNATMEGRVIFREEDLEKVGLNTKEVTDLVIIIPGPAQESRKLLEGESVLLYAHQSIQEIFSAIYVAEMDLEEFCFFVDQHLHKSQYSVVRRMLNGILLDPKVHSEAKKQLLRG